MVWRVYPSSLSRSVELTHKVPCSVANTFVDENGLLFLPAAGVRWDVAIKYSNERGVYSVTTTSNSPNWLDPLYFHASRIGGVDWNASGIMYRQAGMSVRLVCLAQ